MNPNQIHLALVHFPVVLPFVGLALLAAGARRGSAPLTALALVTAGIVAFAAHEGGQIRHAETRGASDGRVLR